MVTSFNLMSEVTELSVLTTGEKSSTEKDFKLLPLDPLGNRSTVTSSKSPPLRLTSLGVLTLRTAFGSTLNIQMDKMSQSHLSQLHCSGSQFITMPKR
jgi:hypothetical protein